MKMHVAIDSAGKKNIDLEVTQHYKTHANITNVLQLVPICNN